MESVNLVLSPTSHWYYFSGVLLCQIIHMTSFGYYILPISNSLVPPLIPTVYLKLLLTNSSSRFSQLIHIKDFFIYFSSLIILVESGFVFFYLFWRIRRCIFLIFSEESFYICKLRNNTCCKI